MRRHPFNGADEQVQIIRDPMPLRAAICHWRAAGEPIALVPTMGALHAGHMALVTAAQAAARRVVVSVFVNPTQFGPNEDYAAYPRDEAGDAAMLRAAGVDAMWAPDAAQVYRAGHATHVAVAGLDARYCGAARPGHFDGVATIVAKLFNQVQPDMAFFGEKDWQQLAIIRRMAADLDFPIAIHGVPIVREDDGLALSSRNRYLTADQRRIAAAFPAALRGAAAQLAADAQTAAAPVLDAAGAAVLAAGFDAVDYIGLADPDSLEPLDRRGRILAAARIGRTRLIDNIAVVPDSHHSETP